MNYALQINLPCLLLKSVAFFVTSSTTAAVSIATANSETLKSIPHTFQKGF